MYMGSEFRNGIQTNERRQQFPNNDFMLEFSTKTMIKNCVGTLHKIFKRTDGEGIGQINGQTPM